MQRRMHAVTQEMATGSDEKPMRGTRRSVRELNTDIGARGATRFGQAGAIRA